MGRIGYFNGTIGDYDTMTIPFSDRSVFYGDAVYDAVLILDQKAFALELHLDRLYKSCAMTPGLLWTFHAFSTLDSDAVRGMGSGVCRSE